MLHMEQAWRLGVKCCSAQAILYQCRRKKEVDISVPLAWVQVELWSVRLYLCADWWNELWVLEIDSGWGWSPPPPLCFSSFSLLLTPLPSFSPIGSSCLFSHTGVEDWSKNWGLRVGWDNTNKARHLVLAVLFHLSTPVSWQVEKLLHDSFSLFHFSQITCLLWDSLRLCSLIFHENFSVFKVSFRFLTTVQFPNSGNCQQHHNILTLSNTSTPRRSFLREIQSFSHKLFPVTIIY